MARKPKTTSEESVTQTTASNASASAQVELAVDEHAYLRSRCGGALRQARESQGISVQDVASKLRLSPKQIDAIEADLFAKLPEPTIVRGFIRNYAKLLKINVEPLLDAYTVIVPSNAQYELTVKPTSNMQVGTGDKPKSGSYIWAAMVALLALGLWLFYQNFVQKPSPILPTVPSANVEALEPLPQPALPAAERIPEQATPLQPSIELTLPPANTDVTALPAPVAEPKTPASSSAVAMTPTAATALTISPAPAAALPVVQAESATVSAGIARLEFNATQETWISIIDADGKTIYDKIIFAGSRESIQAKPPLNVTVGNAGATSLNMNGKAISLAPHTRNNVARIKLE